MPMLSRVALLAALVIVAGAACGNRVGDEDVAGGPSDVTETETTEAPRGSGAGVTDIGITDDTITIGVIADLTGVVPGLFKAAPDAVIAYAAMVNEAGGIHGRMLEVEVFDTGTNDNGNRLAYEEACDQVFASVGSESAFDTGGYEAVAECGFPHLAGFTTDDQIDELDFVFPRTSPDHVGVGAARWLAEEFPEAVQNTAMFYGNVPVTERAALILMEARRSVGWEFTYEQPVATLESNYTPHVLEMERRSVQAFTWVADVNNIVRLQKAMLEQGVSVAVADVTTQGYDQDYLEAAGPAGEGSYVPLGHALLEEADQIEALDEYVTWLEETAPDVAATSNGLQAWARAKMFHEAAEAVGPDLTRDALIAELESMTDWDGGGLIPPTDVGERVQDEDCFVMAQVRDGAYVRVFPEEGFHCSADDVYEYDSR
jgi:ABC-type branched-subunit amino acid transport system substrate-binding protein